MKHFGCEIKTSEPALSRDNYIYDNGSFYRIYGGIDSDLFSNYAERLEHKKKSVLMNYDLNMAYYKSLDKSEFKNYVRENFEGNPAFISVSNLNEYKCSGIYVMVLDNYCQLYVGEAQDICKRIKKHWTNRKDLMHLVFGGFTKSKLSIDSFRALDTTRIFVIKEQNQKDLLWEIENYYVASVPEIYSCNRLAGGNPLKMITSFAGVKSAKLPLVTKNNIADILPNYTWDEYKEVEDLEERFYSDYHYHKRLQYEEFRRTWELEREQARKNKEEAIREIELYGFDAKKDFPFYNNNDIWDGGYSTVLSYIKEFENKGYDISVLKGHRTKRMRHIMICLDYGVSYDDAVRIAYEYERIGDIHALFKNSPEEKSSRKKRKR